MGLRFDNLDPVLMTLLPWSLYPRPWPERPYAFVLGGGLRGLYPAKSWFAFNVIYFNDHGAL